MKPRFFVLLIACLFWQDTYSKNLSDRYAEEYRRHENAKCPIPKGTIKNFVYFSRDRKKIIDHFFLKSKNFAGAQIMYSWRELETEKNLYDFSKIEHDINYLKKHGKQLFIQIQDATFNPNFKSIPKYLFTDHYSGGATQQYNNAGEVEGWVAKRWNPHVRDRFNSLLRALGKRFDGKIEGINLQESAIGVSAKTSPDFSDSGYVKAIKANMTSLRESFTHSITMQYANFMPGEWLPWEDYGYLRSIYKHGEAIGVGLGAPDLMPRKKGQLNHAMAMMHENNFSVPLGIAVQDGNYIGETNSLKQQRTRKNIVPSLVSFADQFLKVDYMFWSDQPPYFKEDVIPCLDEN